MRNINDIILKMNTSDNDIPRVMELIAKHDMQYCVNKEGEIIFIRGNCLYYIPDGEDADLYGLTGIFSDSSSAEDVYDFRLLLSLARQCITYEVQHKSEFK